VWTTGLVGAEARAGYLVDRPDPTRASKLRESKVAMICHCLDSDGVVIVMAAVLAIGIVLVALVMRR
jgi:hypothetical protein